MADRDAVRRWVRRYEEVWRTPGTDAVRELFTEDAEYLTGPWADPKVEKLDKPEIPAQTPAASAPSKPSP